MKCYRGRRTESGVFVTVDDLPLDPRLELHNHSPAGLEWGYGGSGPAQLALAILAHHLRDDGKAMKLSQHFKLAVVARLPEQGWTLSSQDIDQALDAIRKEWATNGGVT